MEPLPRRRRQRGVMTPRIARVLLALPIAVLLAACTGSSAGSTPTAPTNDSPAAAADTIRAFTPLFDGLGQHDPNVIGQGSYWEATPSGGSSSSGAWNVSFTIGWGDCPAGCVDSHTWSWVVAPDGRTPFQAEAGSLLTKDVTAERNAASKVTGVGGLVAAGPTCPVERPGDPACAPRVVGGAVLVVQRSDGSEAARVTTDGSGLFRIPLASGDYTLVPQPVQGFMGQAQPMPFTVSQGAQTWLDVSYDTGIR